ncbi:carbonic anhydrase [Tenacibaculum amylolyticum]|uniref:carbonic anhydrase n=1 Tax=Tenacibaculum amylolyticum TaxID=104269 RepID=UPI003895EC3B
MKPNIFIKQLPLILILPFLFTSCNSDANNDPSETDCIEDFNYDDTTKEGPSNWYNFCVAEGENQCGSTVRQTPVDIVGTIDDPMLTDLNFNYEASTTDIINNGHTIQFNYNGSATLNLQGDAYNLLQFHFHTQSEHTVDSKQYPLEVHLVHQNASKDLAVVGVFFELGSENSFLNQFITHLPTNKDDSYLDMNMNYNASDLFPTNKSYYTYEGSLTTPPCSEIVEWFVMETPLKASQAQLDALADIMHDNFRPIQPLNGRTISRYVQ